MKSIYLLLFFFLFNELSAQTYNVDTILLSGDPAKHINFVILPDGYREEELANFKNDAEKFVDVFFQTPPFNLYKSYFNVFIINVPSNESGADHPGTATDVTEPAHDVEDVDNYFGSTFDYYDIHRLLVPIEDAKIYQVLAANFPAYDQVIILANTPHYGGSGGSFATASLNAASIEVTIHELGHSFAFLADEYYAGDFYAGERVNMTQETDPTKVRWSNWIGENEVGIYQHCCGGNSASWYRPHEYCKMRYLGAPFCPVCTETIVERIHNLAPPLVNHAPEQLTLTQDDLPLEFSLDLIYPEPNSLSVIWELNDKTIGSGEDTLELVKDSLISGDNFLIAYVQDTTSLVRASTHEILHIYTVLWTIENTGLNTDQIRSTRQNIDISVFPNPGSGILNIDIKEVKSKNLKMVFTDINGHEMTNFELNDKQNHIDLSRFSAGTYFLKFYAGKTLINSKKYILH